MTQILSPPGFDADWYAATYADVGLSGLAPAEHYRRIGARLGRPPRPDCAGPILADHAVIAQVGPLDTLPELAEALRRFPPWIDIYVSHPKDAPEDFIADLGRSLPQGQLIALENDGQGFGAFCHLLSRIDSRRYEFFCWLQNAGAEDYPALWRRALLTGVAGSAARITAFAEAFRRDPLILLGGAAGLFQSDGDLHRGTGAARPQLPSALGLSPGDDSNWGCFASTMFWLRRDLAETLASVIAPDPIAEGGPERDEAVQAGERLLRLLVQQRAGKIAFAAPLSAEAELEIQPAALNGELAEPVRDILAELHQRRLTEENQKLLTGARPGLGFRRHQAAPPQPAPRDYSILTPTGDRFAEFHRCAIMVMGQSLKPREWIVVDDGQVPLTERMPLPKGATYIRRRPSDQDPPHTLAPNLLAGLGQITTDRVLILEDDDWYSPLYADFMLGLLDQHELVGLNEIRYYHLTGRAWKNGHPPAHTALAQTAFRPGPASEQLAKICRSDQSEIRERGLVDRHWWHSFDGAKLLVQQDPGLHIGFKGGFAGGLGRKGLASGHQRSEVDYIPDPDAAYLSQILGADLPCYARWAKPRQHAGVIYTVLTEGQSAPPPPIGLGAADFIALTDPPGRVHAPWQALPLDPVPGAPFTPGRDLRPLWALLFPHLLFPDYSWSLWLSPAAAALPETSAALQGALARAKATEEGLILPPDQAGADQDREPPWLLRFHHDPKVVAQLLPLWSQGVAAETYTAQQVIAALKASQTLPR